jgi:predicted nucleotide-binding protein
MAARAYWYDIFKESSHEKLAQSINKAAEQGWEPVQCWSDTMAGHGSSIMGAVDHFCLVRLPVELVTDEHFERG